MDYGQIEQLRLEALRSDEVTVNAETLLALIESLPACDGACFGDRSGPYFLCPAHRAEFSAWREKDKSA